MTVATRVPFGVTCDVIALGPKHSALAFGFVGKGSNKPVGRAVTPMGHICGGFPGQCVHTTTHTEELSEGIESSVVRCKSTGSTSSPNGFLCGYHQSLCDGMNFAQRKAAQQVYMSGRDFDAETIDSIVSHENREIFWLTQNSLVIKLGRGLYVERDRVLAPLPPGAFDGAWDHIDMNPLVPTRNDDEFEGGVS